MAHDLEYPGAPGVPDWSSLYRARGDEVVRYRPVFTGDVFENVQVQGLGQARTKNVILLQHPCALRSNGVDLHPRLMVAEVRQHRVIPVEDWTGHISKMPLPDLKPIVASGKRNQAAFFDEPYLFYNRTGRLGPRQAGRLPIPDRGQLASATVGTPQQPRCCPDSDVPGRLESRV